MSKIQNLSKGLGPYLVFHLHIVHHILWREAGDRCIIPASRNYFHILEKKLSKSQAFAWGMGMLMQK